MSGDSSPEKRERRSVRLNRYQQIMEDLFMSGYKPGISAIEFDREDMVPIAERLGIRLPKNLGDVIYSYRYRAPLPQSIRDTQPEGKEWIIRPGGRGRYQFALVDAFDLSPNRALMQIKVPDATPGLVAMYALTDEQGLLARLRYNRLIDIFTRLTCYSLQNHMRTTVEGIGQVETDEIYVAVDPWGTHFVLPVQAKGGSDRLGVVQIEQDMALCREKFPDLICRPIAAQFMADSAIALFEFAWTDGRVQLAREMHYRLVSPDELTPEDLATYRRLAEPRVAYSTSPE